MENSAEIDKYGKQPELLIDLIQAVINFLDSHDNREEIVAQETQLREISKAIEKLEKVNVAIPDAFRAEKTRLAASISEQSKSTQQLSYLCDELDKINRNLNAKLGRDKKQKGFRKNRSERNFSPKTSNKILRTNVIEALHQLGGSARKKDVMKTMEILLEGKLLPGDLQWRDSAREPVWKNNASWERVRMLKEHILKTDSPTGFWELSEEYR